MSHDSDCDFDFVTMSEEELEAAAGGRRCGTVNIIQTPGVGGYPLYGGAPVAPAMPYSPYTPMPYSPYGGGMPGMPGMPYSPYGYGGTGYGFPAYGMRLGTAI
jgi:hypothetical protein